MSKYTRHALIEYSPKNLNVAYQIYIKSGPGVIENLKYEKGSIEFDLTLSEFSEESTTIVYSIFPKSETSGIFSSEKLPSQVVTKINEKGEVEIPLGLVEPSGQFASQTFVQISGGKIAIGLLISKAVSEEVGIEEIEKDTIQLKPMKVAIYMSENPYYDPRIFLLEHDLDKELIQQTIEITEYMLGNSPIVLAEKAKDLLDNNDTKQLILDMMYKYSDTESISDSSIEDLIKERGYGYLLDIFSLTKNELRVLNSYLPLIEQMKGSYTGLELVLAILGASNMEITEWWQDPINLEVLSYILSIELINKPVAPKLVSKIQKFSRQYVYPLLTQVLYSVRYDFSETSKTPYIGAAVYTLNEIQVWEDFLWLTWASDDLPQNMWSDEFPYQNPLRNQTFWDKGDELIWDTGSSGDESQFKWSDDIADFDVENPESVPAIRSWAANDKGIDGYLLEWFIEKWGTITEEEIKQKLEELEKEYEQEKANYEELWCTEDADDEKQIRTYWASTEVIADGSNLQLSITPIPLDAIVEINGEITNSAVVKKGKEVTYKVYYTGEEQYYPQTETIVPEKDTYLTVTLQKIPPTYTFTINASPKNSKIIISTEPIEVKESDYLNVEETETKTVSGLSGTSFYWAVFSDGYRSQSGSIVLLKDTVLDIVLEEIEMRTLTIIPTPDSAIVTINKQETSSLSVEKGSLVTWTVSKTNYISQSGSLELHEDTELNIELEGELKTIALNILPKNVPCTISVQGAVEYPTSEFMNSAKITAKYGSQISYVIAPKDSEGYEGTENSFIVLSSQEIIESLTRVPKYWGYTTLFEDISNDYSATLYLYVKKNPKVGDPVYQYSLTEINGTLTQSNGMLKYANVPAVSADSLIETYTGTIWNGAKIYFIVGALDDSGNVTHIKASDYLSNEAYVTRNSDYDLY